MRVPRDWWPQKAQFHQPAKTSHEVLYCVKRSLNKRGLVKLFTQAHYSHSSHTNNGFLKLVEDVLQIHPFFFFSHSIKLRALPLSAIIVSLLPCYCYAIRTNDRTIRLPSFATCLCRKKSGHKWTANSSLHDTRIVNLAFVRGECHTRK